MKLRPLLASDEIIGAAAAIIRNAQQQTEALQRIELRALRD
jgi:hypothetical protein